MNLDELQRLAEGAVAGPWEHDSGCESIYAATGYRIVDIPCIAPHNVKRQAANAAYIAAMSPDTAKKLIAAARAALALLPILEEHLFERGPEEEALRSALEELND